MYYAEELINGRLYFKTSPNGKWEEVGYEAVCKRLVEAEKKILDLTLEIDDLIDEEYGDEF